MALYIEWDPVAGDVVDGVIGNALFDANWYKYRPPGEQRTSSAQYLTYVLSTEFAINFVTGSWAGDPDPNNITLDDFRRDQVKAKIDKLAERERLKYITDGAGQVAVYIAKAREAKDYLVDPAPVAGDYPFLSAEVGITGVDLAAVATAIQALDLSWRTIAAGIESARLTGKQAVDAATTIPEVNVVIGDIVWPS